MRSEKWAVFLILTFILIIAAFNSVASLTMLILDKKKDIGILWSMGCDIKAIRKIFLFEGVLISLIGNIVGLGLGAGICYIQIKFKLIEFQGNFVANSIPVTMELQDFIYVFLTVSLIGFITAALPASMIKPDKISI
jgi:lipoprotein-releasing system permease protein